MVETKNETDKFNPSTIGRVGRGGTPVTPTTPSAPFSPPTPNHHALFRIGEVRGVLPSDVQSRPLGSSNDRNNNALDEEIRNTDSEPCVTRDCTESAVLSPYSICHNANNSWCFLTIILYIYPILYSLIERIIRKTSQKIFSLRLNEHTGFQSAAFALVCFCFDKTKYIFWNYNITFPNELS